MTPFPSPLQRPCSRVSPSEAAGAGVQPTHAGGAAPRPERSAPRGAGVRVITPRVSKVVKRSVSLVPQTRLGARGDADLAVCVSHGRL